jgi:hypothetical protein
MGAWSLQNSDPGRQRASPKKTALGCRPGPIASLGHDPEGISIFEIEIEEDRFRPQFLELCERIDDRIGFAANFHRSGFLNQAADAIAHRQRIFDQENTKRAFFQRSSLDLSLGPAGPASISSATLAFVR